MLPSRSRHHSLNWRERHAATHAAADVHDALARIVRSRELMLEQRHQVARMETVAHLVPMPAEANVLSGRRRSQLLIQKAKMPWSGRPN